VPDLPSTLRLERQVFLSEEAFSFEGICWLSR
jgi:hypothetical protein